MNAHAISKELGTIYTQMASLVEQGYDTPEYREALRLQYGECIQRRDELLASALELLIFYEDEAAILRDILGET